MSYEINDDIFPYSAITFITSRWGSYLGTGTGFIVGKKDVLTAAHVIYDSSKGGLADEILIYPSYDPEDVFSEFYSPVLYNYYDSFDPDGDGYILSGDKNSVLQSGTEIDIAHLRVTENLESKYGSFGIDTNFLGGEILAAGYPGKFGYKPTADIGNVTKDLVDDYFSFTSLELNSGNSGGPIFYDDGRGPYAIGIVSTESAILSLSGQKTWLDKNLEQSSFLHQSPYITISSNVSHISEGQQIVFSINYFDKYNNIPIKYNFDGIDKSDILIGEPAGFFELDDFGKATIALTLISDLKTEGPEIFTLNIGGTTFSAVVNDTSKKIDSDSVIYFKGDGVKEILTQSESKTFYQGESYGYVNFDDVRRVEEWLGKDLEYTADSFYPISGTLNYVSASFKENLSFLASNGHINVKELPFNYSFNDVFFNFISDGPNQILGSEMVDTLAAFGNGDFVDGGDENDTFLLSSDESTYHLYDLDISSYSGSIDKGMEITISFNNIENFVFADGTKTFEDIFEEKMLSISSLSDLISSDNANSLKSQYIKSQQKSELFTYDEKLENINFNYIDSVNKICSLNSNKFGTDTLSGFYRINFLDSTLALDLGQGENVGLISRLYNAAFSREADLGGLNFHLSNIEDLNYSFQDVAKSFLYSPEFNAVNGSDLSSSDFIEVLYKNILKRDPSNNEVSWYEKKLEQNTFTKIDVLLGFSESPENISSTIIDEGIWLN